MYDVKRHIISFFLSYLHSISITGPERCDSGAGGMHKLLRNSLVTLKGLNKFYFQLGGFHFSLTSAITFRLESTQAKLLGWISWLCGCCFLALRVSCLLWKQSQKITEIHRERKHSLISWFLDETLLYAGPPSTSACFKTYFQLKTKKELNLASPIVYSNHIFINDIVE